MMTPFERAEKIYQRETSPRSLALDLHLHAKHPQGVIIKRNDCFIMGRPVLRNASYELITDPEVVFGNPDAWFIYLAVGNIDHFFSIPHEILPSIGFEVKNQLRFYDYYHIKEVAWKIIKSDIFRKVEPRVS